jgi:hypothetical protein
MSIGPVTGLPFLVSAFPFMVIDTPFADVKLMVPLPAVAVNFVFCLLKRRNSSKFGC